MAMRPYRILMALLTITLVSAVGCARDEVSSPEPTVTPVPTPEVVRKESTPCYQPGDGDGERMSFYVPDVTVKGNLQWSSDGSYILFNVSLEDRGVPVDAGAPVDAVEADGSRLWDIRDESGSLVDDVPDYAGAFRYFDISPDGSSVAYSSCAYATDDRSWRLSLFEDYEIIVSNIDGTKTQRLTENRHSDNYPVWSPDGTRVAFISSTKFDANKLTIYTLATGESVRVGLLRTYDTRDWTVAPHPPAWSPDGQSIAFVMYEEEPSTVSI